MTDTTPAATPPAIDDQRKASKPAFPFLENTKALVMLGVSGLLILLVLFSGSSRKASSAQAASAAHGPRPAANDFERSLATSQAEMKRLTQEIQDTQAQIANADQPMPFDASRGMAGDEYQPMQRSPQTGGGGSTERSQVADQLAAERQKRDYQSLFSSSVARSYRQASAGPTEAPVVAEAGGGRQASAPAAPGAQAGAYTLFEGTVLEAALINRINTDFAGPVIAQVTTDLLSPDRRRVLVPAGTRLLGEAKATQATGQTRAAVVFHRLIRPDGVSASLDTFPGLDGLGDTGLKDKTNNHYLKIFGASIAVGALGGLSAFGTRTTDLVNGQGALDEFRQGAAGGTGNAATRILDRFLNIPPTITIREGHRLRVFLLKDLSLPPYEAAL